MKKHLRRMLSVLLSFLLLAAANPVGAVASAASVGGNTYYVSASAGADTNNGAENAPFQTIAAGIAAINAGDTLIVKEGIYDEPLVMDSKVGTAEHPITVEARGDVTVKGLASKAYKTAAALAGCAYVVVTGFNFVMADAEESSDRYTLLVRECRSITISHCTLNSESGGATGALRFMDSTGCTLDSTYISGADRISYQWAGTLEGHTFTNNVFATYYGFHLDGNGVAQGCKFYNNVFKTSESGGFRGGSLNECVLANNVFYTANGAAIDPASNTVEYNAFLAGNGIGATDFTVADPKFTDADGGDFSLRSGSPLIGAGSSKYMPERDFTGKLRRAPADIGAYSFCTVYYVDSSAAAGGNGSEESPFRTIADGIAKLNPGDMLVIGAGRYEEPMAIDGKGSEDNLPITIRGEGNVVVNGSDYIHANGWGEQYECALRLENAHNISITGITFDYAPAAAKAYGAAMIGSNSTGILLRGNTFRASGNAAACTQFGSADKSSFTFDANLFEGEAVSAFWAPWGMQNCTITNNIVKNVKGLSIAATESYGDISGNRIVNNTFLGALSSSADSLHKFHDNIVANNIFGKACENAEYVMDGDMNNLFTGNCYMVSSASDAGKTLSDSEYAGDPGFEDAENGNYNLREVVSGDYEPKGDPSYLPEHDYAGNPRKTADVGAYAYLFKAKVPMKIVTKSPDAGKTEVRVTLPVKLTFSDLVDLTAENAGQKITIQKQDGTKVEGRYSVDKNTVTFTPASNFEFETQYVITVSSEVCSKEGVALGENASWSFTTGEDSAKPKKYYVAEDGDDSNSGSITQPVKNASSLIGELKAGDEVIYRQGTYDGIFVLQYKDFTGGEPVVFRSYQGESATLTSNNSNYIFFLGHVRNVKFENLTFSAYSDAVSPRGPAIDAVNFEAGNSIRTGEITITNCRFINCSQAIRIRDQVTSGRDLKMGAIEVSNNVIMGTLPNEKLSSGIFFWECRVENGSYAKVYNNVVINADRSLYFFGRSENLLFYNNTCLDTYDQQKAPGEYDIYAYGGAYNKELYREDLFYNCVFKNNIFTKPIRIQKEYDTTVLEARHNNVFDYNVYDSSSMTEYVTYGGGGEGPQMTFSELQQYKGLYGEGAGDKVLGYEAHGVYAPVEFVDVKSDGRLCGSDNPAIRAATDEIAAGVDAPATDINGAARKNKEAGAYAYDPTLVFVGENSGAATGSASSPFPSVKDAIAQGGTNISVKPGTYHEEGLTVNEGVVIKPYGADGSVVFDGAIAVNGGSVSGIAFLGAVSVSGRASSLTNCAFGGTLTLAGTTDAMISSNDIKAGVILSNDGNTTLQNNVFTGAAVGVTADASAGLKICNNTFVGSAQKNLLFSGAEAVVYNNIFSSLNEFGGGSVISDYNCYNSRTISPEQLSAIHETNSIQADPEFLNARAGDYRLHKLSRCVAAGTSNAFTPAADKDGVARIGNDIGAYALVKTENIYYVSVEGSDGAAGTQADPFKTISQAVSFLRAGERAVVMDGEYTEDLVIEKACNAPDTIAITAQNAGKVTLKGKITVRNSQNVSISGINIEGSGVAVTVDGSENVSISGAAVSGSGTGMDVIDSSLSMADMKLLVYGCGLSGSGAVLNVTRTLFSGGEQAVRTVKQSSLMITASVFSSCKSGIYSREESSLRAVNNSFWNVSGLNIDISQKDGNDTALDLYNNIYSRGGSDGGIFVSIEKGWGFNSESNLYHAAENDKISSIQGSPRTLAELREGGDDIDSLLGDPLYTDPANGDFSPAKGSPAARAGRADPNAPKLSYNGFAFDATLDIGAYYSPFTLRTFHVCPYGIGWGWYDKAPDGDWERPFTKLGDALSVVGSSDTIVIHKGVYDEGRIDIADLHGTKDARITIKGCDDPDCWYCSLYDGNAFSGAPDVAVPLDRPAFTGTQKYAFADTTVSASADLCMKFTDCSYITLENLEIAGFTDCGVWIYGGEGMELKDLKLHNFDNKKNVNAGVMGVLVNNADDCLFKDLTIWDVGYTRRSEADHGMYVGHAENCSFENLIIYQSPGGGIQFYAGDNYKIHASDITIKNCLFVECCDGMIICGAQNFQVINNTFVNSLATDLYLDWRVDGCNFQNNLFYNDYTSGNYPYHRPTSIIAYHSGSGENQLKGNLFTNCVYDYAGAAVCQLGWSESGFSPIDDFAASQGRLNSFNALNPGKAIFSGTIKGTTASEQAASLRSDSVYKILWASDCVNAGLAAGSPSTDILGNLRTGSPDIGAYEADPGREYHITPVGGGDGDGGFSWKPGSADGLSFRLDGPSTRLLRFMLDDAELTVEGLLCGGDPSGDCDGIVSDDGGMLTLNPSFLETLATGTHTIYVLYSDGFAQNRFAIRSRENPPSGSEGTPGATAPNTGSDAHSTPLTGAGGVMTAIAAVFLFSGSVAAFCTAARRRKSKTR